MNWVIVSWIFVALLTAINVFVFIKLKNASMQMMQASGMLAPGTKSMGDAAAQMQNMMKGMGGANGGGMPANLQAMMGQMNNPQMQQQMKAAMDMLAKMQNNNKKR